MLRVYSVILLLVLFGRAGLSQIPDRSTPPVPGPRPEFHLKEIQHLTLSNGIPIILYEKHDVPMVQIDAVIRAGKVDEPPGKTGLATMTATMMMEGAGSRNALSLDDAIDYLGAQLSVDAGYHTYGVSLNTPVGKLDSALALMADVVLRPSFPDSELERRKDETLTALLQWRDEPRTLASVLFSKLLYGDDPYGTLLVGSVQTIQSFTVEDLRRFYQAQFGSNRAQFIVVGDVTAATVIPKLEALFGSWKQVGAEPLPHPEGKQIEETRVYLVDKPDAPQSQIYIGRIGAPRTTPDFYSIVVLNTILGGSFTSRLNENLRETHGYTYGAGSVFDFRVEPGPFIAEAAVQTPKTDSALIEFMKELRNIRNPVPGDELQREKNYVALGFPSEFQTMNQIAGQLDAMVVFHLPDDYFDKYIDRISAVTAEAVEAAARKYIDPDKLVIVVVGDLSKIKERIAALNLGPIAVKTIDDVLGKAPVVRPE
ncbi:MAG: pitrilysin family protein [Bacteroidota bacterium]